MLDPENHKSSNLGIHIPRDPFLGIHSSGYIPRDTFLGIHIPRDTFLGIHFSGYIPRDPFLGIHSSGYIPRDTFLGIHSSGYIPRDTFLGIHSSGYTPRDTFLGIHFLTQKFLRAIKNFICFLSFQILRKIALIQPFLFLDVEKIKHILAKSLEHVLFH